MGSIVLPSIVSERWLPSGAGIWLSASRCRPAFAITSEIPRTTTISPAKCSAACRRKRQLQLSSLYNRDYLRSRTCRHTHSSASESFDGSNEISPILSGVTLRPVTVRSPALITLSTFLKPVLRLSADEFPKIAAQQFGVHDDIDRVWQDFRARSQYPRR